MDSFKNLRTVLFCLGAVVIVGLTISLLASAYQPSDSMIKGVIEKQMTKRLKGGTITSVSYIRGNSFPSQATNSKIPQGTTLFPVVVTVKYTTKPAADGTPGEAKELTRTLNLYRNTSHQWVNDDDLH